MPNRNEAPSMKMLAIRRVSWPDDVDKKEADVYPSAEHYCRDKIYPLYLDENLSELKKWIGDAKLKDLSNDIVKSWIQLSNHYNSTLNDFQQLQLFFTINPPEILNFMEEGVSSLTNEPDKLFPFVLVVPRNSNIQPVTATIWRAIVKTLAITSSLKSVKEMYITFNETEDSGGDKEARRSYLYPFISVPTYDFPTTLKGFVNLTTLIVRGKADDALLETVGSALKKLKFLDISNSSATPYGIVRLFYNNEAAQRRYHRAIASKLDWNMPKYQCLRALTKTLEYFEMSNLPKIPDISSLEASIKIACPQLVATTCGLFFKPVGKPKVICKEFHHSTTFKPLRQILTLNVRSNLAEDIFCFIRGILACTFAKEPSFQLRVDERGFEVGFLILAEDRLIGYCELEKLTVINFTSYSKSACHFIEINLLGHLAPNLQRIKAPLKGTVSEKYPLNSLKQVAIPIVYRMETLTSIIQNCPKLEYIEIRELLLHPKYLDDDDLDEIFANPEHPAENLEVVRILFKNKLSLHRGFTTMIAKCPALKMIGDLGVWDVSERKFLRLHKQLELHNFDVSVEYDGVIHKSGKSDK